MAKERLIVPIFIPHQGCPYRCVYCNQDEITGQEKIGDVEIIKQAFRTYLVSSFSKNLPRHREAAFYGGTFTGLPKARQEFLLSQVQPWLATGLIHEIRVSTHSLYIDSDSLSFLEKYGVRTIELGVQSTSHDVLWRSGRETEHAVVANAAALIRNNGFKLGLQLMLGLPGDSLQTFLKSVEDTLKMRPDFVRLYPALVVRGTRLYEMYLNGEYAPWGLEETIDALKQAVVRFESDGVSVIRVGLHPEPSLLEGYVDGPLHPSMRYLVDCRIGLDRMVALLKAQEKLGERVEFKVPSRTVSIYTGHNKENVKKIKDLFKLNEVSFLEDPATEALELVA